MPGFGWEEVCGIKTDDISGSAASILIPFIPSLTECSV